MGRQRKRILSGGVYEICMRTVRGLPIVCTDYMRLILKGIIARVQRDYKVFLCHEVWMGNHPHIIVVAKDAFKCTQFYGEVKKQITEVIKKLLNLESLTLWKPNGTSVIPYKTLGTVEDRIAYLYANPATANLVDTIEDYPGVSSWKMFKGAASSLDAMYTELCPWIQNHMISKLPRSALTLRQDKVFTETLRKRSKRSHNLVYHPNAWMNYFGVTEEAEIQAVNERIFGLVEEKERITREKRRAEGKKLVGVQQLLTQELSLKYKTKNTSPKIAVYDLDAETRIAQIEEYRHFCNKCRECYLRWKRGDYTVEWPPGAFRPAMPPTANHFA